MREKVMTGLLTFALCAAGAGSASAQQFQTFMFVPGIPGEATDAQHQNWIELLSMSQDAAASKRAAACNVAVLKKLDSAGPALWVAVASGQIFPEIKIEVVKSGGDTSFKLYDIRLGNVRLTSTGLSGSSEIPIEFIAMVPQFVTLTYNRQAPDGSIVPGTPQTVSCQ